MKTKLQFIALASLAVMGAGCLAVATGIIANEKEGLSINAAQLEEKNTSYNIGLLETLYISALITMVAG